MEHYKKGEYVITLFRIVILLLVIRHWFLAVGLFYILAVDLQKHNHMMDQ
jgi:hypothetical protein